MAPQMIVCDRCRQAIALQDGLGNQLRVCASCRDIEIEWRAYDAWPPANAEDDEG